MQMALPAFSLGNSMHAISGTLYSQWVYFLQMVSPCNGPGKSKESSAGPVRPGAPRWALPPVLYVCTEICHSVSRSLSVTPTT